MLNIIKHSSIRLNAPKAIIIPWSFNNSQHIIPKLPNRGESSIIIKVRITTFAIEFFHGIIFVPHLVIIVVIRVASRVIG